MVEDQDTLSGSVKKYDPKSRVFRPVFGEGNLWIKLKIPKIEEEGRKEDIENNCGVQEKDKRVCQFCNKVFSSGKALGGHMRIHFQANKDLVFNKKLELPHQSIKFKKKQQHRPQEEERVIDFVKKKDDRKTISNDHKKQNCIICGKDFPSEKSLFGHMRCHPERDWRGIQPPTMVRNSIFSSLSDRKMDDTCGDENFNLVVDLRESLKNWSVTAKRGRKALVLASNSEISSLEDDQMRDAVNDLMMLAHGDSHESELTSRQKVDESDGTNSTSLNSEAKIGSISPVIEEKHAQFKRDFANEEMGSSNIENHECLQVKSTIKAGDHEIEPKQLNEKYTNLEISNGNVTVKNKKRRKKLKLSDLEMVQNATPVNQKQMPFSDKYHCSTCDRSFPTHQALGGHMSSHKKLKISNPSLIDDQTVDETKESEASNVCKRMLDFDLNELPPSSSEDEAGIESQLVVN